MKAMILAAGFGTRLKPVTNKIPKALIEVNHTPLLELVIEKLVSSGVTEIIINTHHNAKQIESFVREKRDFGIHIEFSRELEILGTGGGLKKAARFFDDGAPFFLHNVDILSTIDLLKMYRYHLEKDALVTLALQQRKSNRFFIVDEKNFICGHENITKKICRMMRSPNGEIKQIPFCGIHVISPKIFDYFEQQRRFSIVDAYLTLIGRGLPVIGYAADPFYWKDVGKLEILEDVQREIALGKIKLEDLIK